MRRWKQTAFWFVLAFAGQAASLRLVDAGTRLHYQHYLSLGRLIGERPLELALLAVQTIVVLAAFRSRWAAVSVWLSAHFKLWQLAGVGLVFILTSATVSENIGTYIAELCFATFVQAVSLMNVVLFAWTIPGDSLSKLTDRREAEQRRGIDRFAILGAIWVAVAAALLSWFSYERHPHIPDEVVYLFHARYFSEGKLALPVPPVPEAFDIDLMNSEGGRWFSTVPPGWPAALAIGVSVGLPWLVNPIFGGLNILLAFWLIQALYGRQTARLALLLLATSPWQVFLAMSFMTHTMSLTFALLGAVGVMVTRQTGKAGWGLIAGLATGVVALVRPLEGVTWAALLGAWIIGVGGARLKPTAFAAFVLGVAAMGGLTLYYNQLMTGDPRVFPIMAYADKYYGRNSNALGFGPDRGLGWAIDPYPGHSPLDALINANLNTFSINIELFGWSIGSLLPLTLFVLAGKPRGPDLLMLGVIAAIFTVHFFYYFSGGPDFGARYWYLMLIPLVVLSVRGVHLLGERLDASTPGHGARAFAAVAALSVLTLLNYFPWRAVDKYYHYEGMRADIRELTHKHQFGRSLVLVRGDRHPDYASAAIYNPLDLQAGEPIYAWDRNPETRKKVIEIYRDRPIWIVEGPSVTGAGFRVAAGPVTATAAQSYRRPAK